MWPFKKKNDNQRLTEALYEAQNEAAYYKARIAAIQDRAFKVCKGESYYVLQGPNGKFAKMSLPYVGEK